MKKITLVTMILVITLYSIFAGNDNSNFVVNGIANSSGHNISLFYGNIDISTETGLFLTDETWRIDDPNILSMTDSFSILTNSGNSSVESTIEVTISPSEFIATLSNNSVYRTSIVPDVFQTSDVIGVFSNNNKTIVSTIPAGDISQQLVLAKFMLGWKGDNLIPAGKYQSTITISYKLE